MASENKDTEPKKLIKAEEIWTAHSAKRESAKGQYEKELMDEIKKNIDEIDVSSVINKSLFNSSEGETTVDMTVATVSRLSLDGDAKCYALKHLADKVTTNDPSLNGFHFYYRKYYMSPFRKCEMRAMVYMPYY